MVMQPKVRRLNPPTDGEIEKGLRRHAKKVPEVIERALTTRGLPSLLAVIDAISETDAAWRVSSLIAERFRTDFALLGSRTVLSYASAWLSKIECQYNKRNYALLLSYLVHSIDLLRNKELCVLLKESIPPLYKKLYTSNCHGVAGAMLQLLFLVSVAEVSYVDGADSEGINSIWTQLLGDESVKSPNLLLSVFLVKFSLKLDCDLLLEILAKRMTSVNQGENQDDQFFCSNAQFFSLLLEHLPIVVSRCSLHDGNVLVSALINFHMKKNTLEHVCRYLLEEHRFFDECGTKVVLLLFWAIIATLRDKFVVLDDSSKESVEVAEAFNAWIASLLEIIEFNGGCEDATQDKKNPSQNIWKKGMRKFLRFFRGKTERLPLTFPEALDVLCSPACPLDALPSSIREALLSLYLVIFRFSAISFSLKMASFVLLIVRSDVSYFRNLLGSIEIASFHWLLKRKVPALDLAPEAAELWKHYLLSDSSSEVFVEKGVYILKESSTMTEEIFFISAIVDAFCEQDFADEATTRNFISGLLQPAIVKCVSKQLNSEVLASISMMKATIDLLKPWHQFQQIKKRFSVNVGDDTTALTLHLQQVSEEICKKCRKLLPLDDDEETLLIKKLVVGDAVEFLCCVNKLEGLMKWKYLIDLVQYGDAIVEKVLLSCSPEEMEVLFASRLPKTSKVDFLKVCIIIARLKNKRKQILLNTIFDALIEFMCDASQKAPQDVLLLARLFLQHVSNGDKQRDYVSIVLGLISVMFPFLDDSGQIVGDGEAELILNVEDTLLDCLHLCHSTVLNDQCALYCQLFSCTACFVQQYGEKEDRKAHVEMQLSYKLAKIAQLMSTHKPFSRILPFVVSECLQNPKRCTLALYKLLSQCDEFSTSHLTSSLPSAQKRQLAALYPQYRKANEFVI